MSKLSIAILMVTAFFYALWLVLFGRKLPDPARARGLRRRFILATLLFAGLLAGFGKAKVKQDKPLVTCYSVVPIRIEVSVMHRKQVVATVQAVWRTLDRERGEEFRAQLEAAARRGAIRRKTADMLAVAFQELAYHHYRTRGEGRMMTCYRPSSFGYTMQKRRESALKQIELLRQARQSGTIDEETAAKAHEVLAQEVDFLHRAQSVKTARNGQVERQFLQQQDKVTPSDSAVVAAGMIVEMEGGQVPEFTTAQRLATMKEQVEKLLKKGPVGNDWIDPAIRPNLSAVLEKGGLIQHRSIVMCYKRAATPVRARSEELKRLQQRILDQKVKAGVLAVEVAEKVSEAPEPKPDYATEKDIRGYQTKMRRVVRMLYKHGELTSGFVRKLEQAADLEMIRFNPAKALRNDMGYQLRSLFWQPMGDEVIRLLETQKLIPKLRNQRMRMNWFGRHPTLTEAQRNQMEELKSLIEGQDVITLAGDGQRKISRLQIPRENSEYRMKMRRVCRALVQTKLVQMNRLKPLEKLIGISLVGRVE